MADQKVTALTALTALSGDETLYIVEDDDGTPLSRRITIEDFLTAIAARTELTSVYAPLTTTLFLHAGSFAPVSGSPVLGAVSSSLSGFLFDSGGTEVISTIVHLPPTWSTFDIELWWTNGGAGSGNVVWRLDVSAGFGDGESADPSSAGSNTTATAPTALTNKVTTVRTGVTAPTSGEAIAIRPRRIGADAGDTLANDACLLGIRLVKAS